jgi:prepilin-type N-terminal cleavage/methylation domain-containing protein
VSRRLTQRGLTLVELLAALAVLAVLAALSVRGVGSLVHSEMQTRAEHVQWHAVGRVAQQMQRDFSLALEAPVLDAQNGLLVRRRSDADRAGNDIRPRNVAFRLQGERLEYLTWPGAAGAAPEIAVALENVRSLEWRVFGEDGAWTSLQALTPAPADARAMEARLTFAGGEQVSRIFVLP